MTGVDINKIRHYAPGFNNRTTRLDADMSALLFKAGTRVISSSERLIADVSIKAAMGAGAPSDDKKRGLQSAGKSKYVNINGLVYDPTAKKQEGQFFKPWITERERINAMRSSDPVPNWGWIDRNPEHQNKLEAPRNSKGKVTRYPVNPKTGEPMKNYGFDQEFKSLGPTLGEKNPGGKLLARTAKAFGLVVDALGKFRCPPGTPAANRFTNERGEGCFDISVAQVRNLVGALTNSMQGPQNRSQIVSSLASAGLSIAEIRKSYKENGIAGLASLARRVGIDYVGEKWNDSSYVSQISVRLREISGLTMGTQPRMERIVQQKAATIDFLATRYGITETDEYLKIGQIVKAMSADPDSPLAPNQFELLFRGGTPESHEDWAIDALIETHIEAINQKLGLGGTPDVIRRDPVMMARVAADAKEEYLRAMAAGEVTPITQFINAGLKREKDFRLGAFEDMVIAAHEQPHSFTMPNGSKRVYAADVGAEFGYQYDKNGEAWPDAILINSGPALQGFRDTPPPGYMDLYEATGGDIDDQWRAVASAMDADERLRAYATLWSTDLAATEGRGWRDFGAQTSAHERAHWGQMDAIFQHHVDTNPGVSIDSLSNDELMDLTTDFMKKADPDTLRAVFGADIEDLIDKRFDALAGAYSQALQQEALGVLTGGGSAESFNYAKNLALLETLAELKANKSVGLIGDDPDLDEILEKMDPLPPMTGGSISPSGGVVPSRPDGSPSPRFVPSGRTVPALPGSAPTLPTNAGKVVTVTPGRSGGGGMGRIDADSPEWRDRAWRFLGRKSHFSDLIREGKLTDEDISDMIHGYRDPITGRKINGLLWQLQWEERMRVGTEIGSDNKKREYLKAAYEGMGITVEEIERIVLKIDNGEAIEESERESLLNAANHLRKTAIFHHAERDALLNQVEILKQRIGPFDVLEVTNPNIDPNRKKIIQDIARLEFEADSHYGAGMALTRGAMAKMEDLVDASDHRPEGGWKPGPRNPTRAQRGRGYSSELSSASHRSSAVKQSLKFSPEEKIAIDSISMKPLDVSVSTSSVNNLDELIENEENVMSVFERYDLPKPQTQLDSEVNKASTAMSAIEKTKTDTDLVVEMEIDTPEDYSPGAIFELDSISSTELITDLGDDIDERSPGFASRTKMPAAMAARMLSSSKSRKLLEKLGVPEERVDSVAFVGELAAAFSIGGPPGLLVVLGRRGGKDLGEYGIKIALEKGWITQDIADKARKFGLDRIASEGLPDEITDLASSLSSSVMTEKNKEAAREIVSAASEQIEILTSSTTRKAKEVAGSGKEKALELADSGIERAKKLKNRIRGGGLSSTINIQSPTDDIEEAKTTGRPLSVLRPGTMPTKSQKQYDFILETGGKDFLSKEPQETLMHLESKNPIYKDLWRAVKEEYSALGFSEEEVEIINNGLRDYLLLKTMLLQKERNETSGKGYTKEEKFRYSERALKKADIAIAFPADVLEKLIADGRFKTQFETKTSGGVLAPELRKQVDVAQLGYHPDTAPEMRPVYGYLTSGGVINKNTVGNIKEYGEVQFILKRDTHERSTYTTSDSLYLGATPSPMGVPSGEAGGIVGGSLYAEAQIHGGLSLSDVDYVVVNVGEPEDEWNWKNKVSEEKFESISGMLARVGIRVVPLRDGEIVDTWNGGKIIPEPPADIIPEQELVGSVV